MTSTHEGHINIAGLPPAATLTHIVPEMTTHNLLSVGQLCDAGCTAKVTKDDFQVTYNDTIILEGTRSPETTLWELPRPINTSPDTIFPYYANAAVGNNTPANMVAFMHAAFFSPAISTLEKALQLGYINNIPGFTSATLKRHPPRSAAMIKGHLDQTRKNLRSTKDTTSQDNDMDEPFPFQLTCTEKTTTNFCYATVFSQSGKMYSDQTGNFFQASSKGNLSIMILYDYDSNAILAEPIKNRKAETLMAAYEKMHKYLTNRGMKPKTQILDNECSALLKDYMIKNKINYQLAAPGQHRTNAAERAIRTFKNHFVAGLCSTDEHFPIHLWDRLVEQAVLTLNLMRGSRMNPKHSAWSQLNGPYDFNAKPLAPPGIHVLVHEKPDQRKTWGTHANDAWYIGPALEHYRCYKVYMRETQSERITDTLTWFPQQIPLPTASSTEIIAGALHDVITELKSPTAPNALVHINDSERHTLINMSNILTKIITEAADETTHTKQSSETQAKTSAPPRVVTHDDTAPTYTQRTENKHTVHNNAPSPRVEEQPVTKDDSNPREDISNINNDVDVPTTDHDTDLVKTAEMPPKQNKQLRFAESLPTYKTYDTAIKATLKGKHVSDAIVEKYPHIPTYEKYSHKRVTRQSSKHAYVLSNAPQFALYGNAINPDTNQPAEYLELSQCSDGPAWMASASEEFGRLAQGNGTTVKTGTDTIRFIHLKDIPQGKTITYLKIVVADRPEKTNPKRVRATIGGDRIKYDGDTSTKAAELTTCKIYFNSVISTPNAKCLTGDLKDFYLQTARMPEKDYAYMMVPLNVIPPDIIEKYGLLALAVNGKVYVEVSKGIYGLPQAGKLANQQLIQHLEPFGYAPVPHTAGLWKHKTRDISFLLVVDDFAIKYTNKDDAEHLLAALQTEYKMSIDWKAERYCGLILAWDYNKRTCDISMPGYIERALTRFRHPKPKKPQHNPFKYIQPEYGAKVQLTPDKDTSEKLDAQGKKRIQEVLGTLLYYARAVDPTLLVTVSSLATQQKDPTIKTMAAIDHLLDYCATHPNAITRFHPSDMVLHVESDASYLSEANSKSRSAGFHYLSDDPKGKDVPYPPINGPVLVSSKIIKETVSSAAEAELAALYHNGQDAYPLRIALEELNHPQPPTPIQTDNSTASGLANDTLKQKRSKAMDMRWFWIRDKVNANIYNVYWNTGKTNKADYFSKQHPTKHHIDMRSTYIYSPENPVQNYFDNLRNEDIQWIDDIAAATFISQQHPKECSKGVLIPHSGLHLKAVSKDPHSNVTYVTKQAMPNSDAGCFTNELMNIVDSS